MEQDTVPKHIGKSRQETFATINRMVEDHLIEAVPGVKAKTLRLVELQVEPVDVTPVVSTDPVAAAFQAPAQVELVVVNVLAVPAEERVEVEQAETPADKVDRTDHADQGPPVTSAHPLPAIDKVPAIEQAETLTNLIARFSALPDDQLELLRAKLLWRESKEKTSNRLAGRSESYRAPSWQSTWDAYQKVKATRPALETVKEYNPITTLW